MAKISSCPTLFAVQLIIVAVTIHSVQVNGFRPFEWGKQLTKTVARSLVKVPSMVADGSQYATQKVAGTVGNAVSPVTPLKTAVDVTGRAVSNVLGSTSRLLGKDVRPAHGVMFLYGRRLEFLGSSRPYRDAVNAVIGLALSNVVLHADEMTAAADGRPVDLDALPVLAATVRELRRSGAGQQDVDVVVWALGRNGRADVTQEMQGQILGAMKDINGIFRTKGVIEEIRWISQHPRGFYKLDESECNDYKLNTDKLYSSCTVIHPPKL